MLKRALLLLMVIFTTTAFAASDRIHWQTYSSSVFKQAKKQNRLVLLFGEAEWCPWCKATKQESLTDPDVIKVINTYYVPVMVDVDKEARVANQYNIMQLPTFVVLSADGKLIETYGGYTAAKTWLARFQDAANENLSGKK